MPDASGSLSPTARPPVVGIMGGAACSEDDYEDTRWIAGELAREGWVILCGGRGGVMEAAARGAAENGGLAVGVMPGSDAAESPPNPWIRVVIFTGLSDARNAVNVRSSDVVLAIGGAYGTLSEIALAAKIGKPVVLYRSWNVADPPAGARGHIETASTKEDALRLVKSLHRT